MRCNVAFLHTLQPMKEFVFVSSQTVATVIIIALCLQMLIFLFSFSVEARAFDFGRQ